MGSLLTTFLDCAILNCVPRMLVAEVNGTSAGGKHALSALPIVTNHVLFLHRRELQATSTEILQSEYGAFAIRSSPSPFSPCVIALPLQPSSSALNCSLATDHYPYTQPRNNQ